jgi:membrane protease YdiL (CAAX protease family)
MSQKRFIAYRYRPGLFALSALAIVFVSYQLIGGGLSLLLFGSTLTVDNVSAARWSTFVGQIVFLLIPTLLLARRQHGRWSAVLPFRRSTWAEYLLTIITVFSLLQFLNGYMFFQDHIPMPSAIKPIIDDLRRMMEEMYRVLTTAHSSLELAGVIVVVAIVPAICEETLFRGLVQTNLRRLAGPTMGFVYTGLIFGVYHLNPFFVVPLILLGIYFSFLRERSANILIPMVAHCTNNCVSVLTGYFAGDKAAQETLPFVGENVYAVLLSMLGFGLVFAVSFAAYWKITARIVHENETEPQPLDPAMCDVLGTAANEAGASLITANLKTAGISTAVIAPEPEESADPQALLPPVQILVLKEELIRAKSILEELDLMDFLL